MSGPVSQSTPLSNQATAALLPAAGVRLGSGRPGRGAEPWAACPDGQRCTALCPAPLTWLKVAGKAGAGLRRQGLTLPALPVLAAVVGAPLSLQ